MPLSDIAIRKAKPRTKAYRLADSEGLSVLVRPSGTKSWQYRYRFLGKENILSFGKYPIIGLADARQKRNDAKRLLYEGQDPAAKRRDERIAAKTAARETFGLIAEEYLQQMADNGASAATLSKNTWLLTTLAQPLTHRPIRDINAAEILDVLKRIEKSGRRESARRLRGVISSVYKLAIVTLRAADNPTLHLHGALLSPKRVGRAAIIDERKFGQLLTDIDEFDGWPTISAALKFLSLTCVRPGEVRRAVRDEFDFKKAVWEIPAERMKTRVPHLVPLSEQALTVLHEVWELSEGYDLVFPSIRSAERPLSENAFNSAIRRMGYAKEEMTAHGFRVSASSILNSRGYDSDVIEAILAHQDRNSIRRTYNRATYWDQRMELMQIWADLCDGFRSGKIG